MHSTSNMASITLMVIFLAMFSTIYGEDYQASSEEEEGEEEGTRVCSTIFSNQVGISRVKEDMKELTLNLTFQLLETNHEIKELMLILYPHHYKNIGQIEELDSCRIEANDLGSQVSNLTKKNQEATLRNEIRKQEKDSLRREVEDLLKAKQDLEVNIQHLKKQIPLRREEIGNLSLVAHLPIDCADLQIKGERESGVYTIYPYQTEEVAIDVQCDFDSNGGSWTVFFSRMPQDEPEDFNLPWNKFKEGFGKPATEYWMGNDFLHGLTSYRPSSLRIDAQNFTGYRRWAEWTTFYIDNEENKYQLTLEQYHRNSTLGDSFSANSKSYFTTFDQDNDSSRGHTNCALGTRYFKVGHGAWWYKSCGNLRPTAPLMNTSNWESACWADWDPQEYKLASLMTLSMKFRRHNYKELARRGVPTAE